MAAKSELLSLSEICKRLNEKSVVIPLLQRNYKWDVEGNSGSDNTLEINSIGKTAYTDFSGKRARQVTRRDYEYYDYLLCADTANVRNTMRITGPDYQDKIHLLLDYAGRHGQSIADPWYTGRFDETYRDVCQGCEGFLEYLRQGNRL